jgi:CheY-like chemotaxis protein
LDKIFDPFFTTKDPGKGSGMGLSVARRIVDDHSGAITVDNDAERGVTFHVYLPLVDRSLPSKDKKVSPLEGGDERILLIDDEATLVEATQNMLQNIGYRVIGVTSSKEALNIFEAQPDVFDIVITDQVMPDLTGIDLVKKITHIRPNIPLILMTGFSESVSAEESENLGIDAYLMKPVDTRKMATTIRRVLEKKK